MSDFDLLEYPPFLPSDKLPEAERKPADVTWYALCEIGASYGQFNAAVQLYQFSKRENRSAHDCLMTIEFAGPDAKPSDKAEASRLRKEGQKYTEWMGLAGRGGAISVYNFGKAIESIGAMLKLCPSLRFNSGLFEESRKTFAKRFKWRERMRHAVAHQAELVRDPENLEKNSIGGLVIASNFSDDAFEMGIGGRLIGIQMTEAGATVLNRVKRDIYQSFREPTEEAPQIPKSD